MYSFSSINCRDHLYHASYNYGWCLNLMDIWCWDLFPNPLKMCSFSLLILQVFRSHKSNVPEGISHSKLLKEFAQLISQITVSWWEVCLIYCPSIIIPNYLLYCCLWHTIQSKWNSLYFYDIILHSITVKNFLCCVWPSFKAYGSFKLFCFPPLEQTVS